MFSVLLAGRGSSMEDRRHENAGNLVNLHRRPRQCDARICKQTGKFGIVCWVAKLGILSVTNILSEPEDNIILKGVLKKVQG